MQPTPATSSSSFFGTLMQSSTLRWINIFALVLHVIWAFVCFILAGTRDKDLDWSFQGKFPTVDHIPVWYQGNATALSQGRAPSILAPYAGLTDKTEYDASVYVVGNASTYRYSIMIETVTNGSIEVKWLLPMFFAVTALFHLLAFLIPRADAGEDDDFIEWEPRARIIGNSIAIPMIILAFAVECGVYDRNALISLTFLTCMGVWLEFVAELMFDMGNEAKKGDASSMAAQWNTRLWIVPCVLSLLACLTAISLPIHMFARSRDLSPLKASNEAIMFVGVVSAFYILHRLGQALLLLYRAFFAASDDLKNEKFIQRLSVLLCLIHSIIIKTLLGWLLFGPIIASSTLLGSK